MRMHIFFFDDSHFMCHSYRLTRFNFFFSSSIHKRFFSFQISYLIFGINLQKKKFCAHDRYKIDLFPQLNEATMNSSEIHSIFMHIDRHVNAKPFWLMSMIFFLVRKIPCIFFFCSEIFFLFYVNISLATDTSLKFYGNGFFQQQKKSVHDLFLSIFQLNAHDSINYMM